MAAVVNQLRWAEAEVVGTAETGTVAKARKAAAEATAVTVPTERVEVQKALERVRERVGLAAPLEGSPGPSAWAKVTTAGTMEQGTVASEGGWLRSAEVLVNVETAEAEVVKVARMAEPTAKVVAA